MIWYVSIYVFPKQTVWPQIVKIPGCGSGGRTSVPLVITKFLIPFVYAVQGGVDCSRVVETHAVRLYYSP